VVVVARLREKWLLEESLVTDEVAFATLSQSKLKAQLRY
jgi:hypothetical protein